MKTYLLEREQWLPKPIDEVFSFFSRPENLQVLTPDWLEFRVLEAPQSLTEGSRIRYRLRWRFLPIRWTTEITKWDPPHRFVDREIAGLMRCGVTSTHSSRIKWERRCMIASLTRSRLGLWGGSLTRSR